MKTKVNIILFLLFVLSYESVQAVDKTFTIDGVIQDGDEYGNVFIYDSPPDHTTVDMTGGLVDSLFSYDESITNIGGGSINTLNARDASTTNVFGGDIYGLHAWNDSEIYFSGFANVNSLSMHDFGLVHMNRGVVEFIHAGNSGVLNIYNGLIIDSLNAFESANVNIYGYNLIKTDFGGSYGYGQVRGSWYDNLNFVIEFNTPDTYSHVNLIPEPNSLMLIFLGILFFKRRNNLTHKL